MHFNVFERADGAWLLVAGEAASPLRHSGQLLRLLGDCVLDLAALDVEVVFQLGMDGRAVVTGRERDALRQALQALGGDRKLAASTGR